MAILCIIDAYDIYINDGNAIKEHIRNHFNAVLKRNGWGDCQDSTSALTTELRYFTKGNNTKFKIDLAIIQERNNAWFRLIHRKTSFVLYDQWYWSEAPQSTNLSHRTNILKHNHLWKEVIDTYLEKKNMYLRRQDQEHPSFVVYIEAVNEIYHKYF